MIKQRIVLLFSILYFLFSIGGCGYTTRGFVYPENKIVISPVKNKIDITSEERTLAGYKTFPILIENKMTNELVSRFNTYGHLKVVNEEEDALKLSCSVVDYDKEALRYVIDSDEVREQRLRLRVEMKLLGANGELLQDKTIVGETEYFLTGTGSKSEASARDDLIDDTTRRILEAVTEAW